MPYILFVTGMHRSGTSLVAADLVERFGRHPSDLLSPASDNPRGFFESREVVGINEKILEYFGSNWRDPSPLPEHWLRQVSDSPVSHRLDSLVENECHIGAPLVLKDPRFSRTLPLWLKACALRRVSTGLVVVYRNPVSVARSLWARNHIPSGHALQLWCRYYIDLQSCREKPAGINIRIEDYCQAPAQLISSLKASGLSIDGKSRMKSALDASLLHYAGAVPESVHEKKMHEAYQKKHYAPPDLNRYYDNLGGDWMALERRHYGTVAMILDQVVQEKAELTRLVQAAGLSQDLSA